MRSQPARYWVAAIVELLCPALARAELHLGVYAQDITPPKLPVNVSADFYNRTADKINRPLYARSFVLDHVRTKIVRCIIDSCGVGRQTLASSAEDPRRSYASATARKDSIEYAPSRVPSVGDARA